MKSATELYRLDLAGRRAGSGTVLIGNLPAARVNDMTLHSSCVAPIPSPVGKILPPGCPTVMIGG